MWGGRVGIVSTKGIGAFGEDKYRIFGGFYFWVNSQKIASLVPQSIVTGGSRLKLPTSPPSGCHIPTIFTLSYSSKFMVKMSIHSTPSGSAIPIDAIVLGCGMVALDYLVTVDSYPKPDDKIRSTSFQVQGGGNTGNAMTCAARLGLTPRIISKVADDSQGKRILNELEADGIDTSFIVVSQPQVNCESLCASCTFLFYARMMCPKGAIQQSLMSLLTVKRQHELPSIHQGIHPSPMVADDLPDSSLSSALDGARLVYTDGVLHEAALVVA
ncbi:hypothetical protein MTR67_036951 [Solanum verrucosum]|uniref:Carbohydrate kinase PfkB domain-containing protein n=1 Tax=Solanum verrucosum TaxID=315347 RepID=A0AAF0UDB8_SOLVR|nr:hypothetical protein MTR67_036951 [Solanum verrucosum]